MSRAIVIRIRLFAGLREQAGWAEQEWTADITAEETRLTPAMIWNQLDLPGSCASVRVAINHQFASADTELRTGDELGFLPPISGG
jgi:molybdopterin synthase sulfur carrier subunit